MPQDKQAATLSPIQRAIIQREQGRDVLCAPETLASLMKEGDVEALDRLSRCYGRRLLEVGRHRCGDEDRAQDAVQDALLAAGEHLQDFRGEGSIEGWLVRMVTNACHRMRRGRKNNPALHADLDLETPAEPDDSPEAVALRVQMGQQLNEALERLDPRDRTLLLLGEGQDWKGPELAEALGMTPAAVRTRLSRIRKKMRARLGPLWDEFNEGAS
ncbi:sigma-70 family RNA polymerase sigma factor [Myxococcota bacterium]|nr:sigma-70 family RNA polymerase sigma factor [Myxococcota bacterium]MBU1432944.1 sigma-70 family RNA polymerase sigma factor [Myxococcota bacterium]MBU1896246.1 sigma-70 family RNA polymerase sigma factor [Myxococcota bacterium]